MNVALATATALPLPVMAARSGNAVDKGADTGTPPMADAATERAAAKGDPGSSAEDLPVLGRYPRVAVRFDQEASRLVLLFRDPADGATVEQIPTEAALKQYREAQQDRKDGKPSLHLLVGGADGDQAQRPGQGAGAAAASQGNGKGIGQGAPPPHRAATVSHTASGYPPTVVYSSPATTHIAASSGTSSGSGSARVNVVI